MICSKQKIENKSAKDLDNIYLSNIFFLMITLWIHVYFIVPYQTDKF